MNTMSKLNKHLAKYSDKQIEQACSLIEEKLILDEYIEIDADLDHLQFLIIAKAVDDFIQKLPNN